LLHLADCDAARGDAPGALAYSLRALAIREKKLGPAHAKTREALADVGARYAAVGDSSRARTYADRSRAILTAP
jgi:hypothetical protein